MELVCLFVCLSAYLEGEELYNFCHKNRSCIFPMIEVAVAIFLAFLLS
jgi:hypothetical protein